MKLLSLYGVLEVTVDGFNVLGIDKYICLVSSVRLKN